MSVRRRAAWGVLDQVLSSGSNFAVIVVAARSLSADGFGRFVLAMTVCTVGVFLARGLASDPLATAHASDQPEAMHGAMKAGAATSWLSSLIIAIPAGLTGAVVGGEIGAVLLVIALMLPGLSLQDFARFALIVQGRPRATFLNDLFWTLAQVPLLVLAILFAPGESVWLMLAWAGAGNLAAGLGLVQMRVAPGGPALARGWLGRHRSLWPYYVLDNMFRQASILLLILVLSVTTSIAQVGAFRGAMTFYAPLAILSRGLVGVAVPELARRQDDPAAVRRSSLVLAWTLAPLAIVVGVATLFLPDSAGRLVLGDTWELAAPLLLLAAGPALATQFIAGIGIGIRALGAGREGLTARILASSLAAAFAAVGAVLGGAYGAMLTLALSAPLQMLAWWWLLAKASRVSSPSATVSAAHRQ